MAVSRREPKPIAVLCNELAHGRHYILGRIGDNVAEYSNHNNVVYTKTGQRYFLINNADQLMGLEISDFFIAPGFGKHPDAEAIVQRARERKR